MQYKFNRMWREEQKKNLQHFDWNERFYQILLILEYKATDPMPWQWWSQSYHPASSSCNAQLLALWSLSGCWLTLNWCLMIMNWKDVIECSRMHQTFKKCKILSTFEYTGSVVRKNKKYLNEALNTQAINKPGIPGTKPSKSKTSNGMS